ncbi:MAG: hypothetical protein AUH81_06755 [Candidatus Rokubacteria bacterium 13_1_40CM_4_69_5]|nr:MAG: hypothetical protein AUH81_06755 [Candidatus Rokubacteria bacterium 13_1_40CM_4_69_5]
MKIGAFRGYRYGLGQPRDLSKVVAPPYDQISPQTQEQLLALSPHNIVRVTLPRDQPGADKYQGARQVLEAWLAEGVWAREERPAIYPYHQTYAVGGASVTRAGFVALGEVSDYGEGIVRPHERTHAGPKQDRMRLLETTGADVGLLFMLVSDPQRVLLEALTPTGEPIAEARDLQGQLHRVWRITDGATIAGVQALMAPKSVIIADGHHRYETAVEYARRRPGARHTIFPNHRLVHHVDGFTLEGLGKAACAWFDVGPLDDPLRFRPTNRTVGVVAGRQAMVFGLREDAFERLPWPRGTSRAWRRLAVSILHEGLLKPFLDVTDEKLDAKTHVDYTADQAEAVGLARAGRCQAAFLIAPTTAEELRAVVDGGERLPQKSTHFYPKLLDGLVFHRYEESSEEGS